MLSRAISAASFPAFAKLLLGDGPIDGLFLARVEPPLSFAQNGCVPRAGTPLNFIDVERAGISARDPSLNVVSQLLELYVVEAFFLFHLAQCLALFMANVKQEKPTNLGRSDFLKQFRVAIQHEQ